MWIDDPVDAWGEGEDDCMDFVNTSIRPCYKFTPLHLQHKQQKSALIDVDIDMELGRGEGESKGKGAQRGSQVQEVEASEGSSGEGDEDSDDESSEYISTSDEEATERKNRAAGSAAAVNIYSRLLRRPIQSLEELKSNNQLFEMENLIDLLIPTKASSTPSTPSMVEMGTVVNWVAQFHQVAVDANIQLSSPKYRYMLKRAYLEYLMAVCETFGSKLFDVSYCLPAVSLIQLGTHSRSISLGFFV
jgi:hypothetical protein